MNECIDARHVYCLRQYHPVHLNPLVMGLPYASELRWPPSCPAHPCPMSSDLGWLAGLLRPASMARQWQCSSLELKGGSSSQGLGGGSGAPPQS